MTLLNIQDELSERDKKQINTQGKTRTGDKDSETGLILDTWKVG